LRKPIRSIPALGLCGLLLLANLSALAANATITQGTMLHAQQVLERYSASGEPLLQYFELWLDASRITQRELGADGQPLSYVYSGGTAHLAWDADTLKADKLQESQVFLLDYTLLEAGFSVGTALSGQTYAGRPCTVTLLIDPENNEDWLKVYLDDQTSFVLFCEAPLFRLRTALLETLPTDEVLLTPPAGLVF
jgi:hypothetical protein